MAAWLVVPWGCLLVLRRDLLPSFDTPPPIETRVRMDSREPCGVAGFLLAVYPESPLAWQNVAGSRSRQMLRDIEHTAAVHRLVAALSRQACSLGWEVTQLDPPRRASR